MDLMFAVSGLLLLHSLARYLQRERRLLARVVEKKPKQIYMFEVPLNKKQTIHELKHFVKRNHLGGIYAKGTTSKSFETWLFKTENSSSLRYPLYIEEIDENRSIIELGAESLNSEPYFLFKRKHRKAALALGAHFETSWKRKIYAETLAGNSLISNHRLSERRSGQV